MKSKILTTLLLVFSINIVFGLQRYNVIPQPNTLIERSGEFQFKERLSVECDPKFTNELELMKQYWKEDFFTEVNSSKKSPVVVKNNSSLGEDQYKLTVEPKRVVIEASSPKGASYAITTLRQLTYLNADGAYSVPACAIDDAPYYKWRAFMLDDVRYFRGKKVVKTMLDQMAYLKMSIFHWHLVDDQGWRIEIKKYPLLTQVGAWRDRSQTARVPKGDPIPCNAIPHGGYYTQQDIKEIVDYATKRHITVVPEIEMPGHASAAIASYPWLSSADEKIDVSYWFGVLYPTYNVADPKVYTFLTDVIGEVIDLFPSKIIHIGGDEVKYDQWNKNPQIQALIKKEGLSNAFDVQVFFVNKISKFISDKGARMMGWNEIMGKNVHEWATEKPSAQQLAPNAIVHFWKGEPTLLKEAIEGGYSVVNSNHWDTYISYSYETIPLKKSYEFSPYPTDLDPKFRDRLLGLGCQVWCEYLPKVSDLYWYVFPRIAAYAEVGWTEPNNKKYDIFIEKLEIIKRYWDKEGITYYSK